MRGALSGVRHSFGVWSPVRLGAIVASGFSLGIGAVLILAPTLGSANDDAGIRSVQMQDARARNANRAPAAYAPVPAAPAYRRERFEVYQPIVRSFAPQPRPARALPAPIQYGYGGTQGPAEADSQRPLGPVSSPFTTPALKRKTAKSSTAAAQPALHSTRTMCVRLCDGYAFPVGNMASSADWVTHTSLCQSACPAAATRLYSLAPGAGDLSQAVARDGSSYGALTTAFAFRKGHDASCTCQKTRQGEYPSLLRDITLRAGDTVVIGAKAKVFQGSSQLPYKQSDFADFRRSHHLNKAQRQQLDSLTSASLNVELLRPFTVAQAPVHAPDVAVLRPTAEAASNVRTVTVDSSRPLLRASQGFAPLAKAASSIQVVQGKSTGFVVR